MLSPSGRILALFTLLAMLSPQPSVQIVVAHHGAVYQLIFPGDACTFQPEQRQALASLRFIPRIGHFPGRPGDPFLAAALRRCASVRTTQTQEKHDHAAQVNGPLLALDQRGSISAQVQITPRHDEILAVMGGRVTRVLARRLTTYTCCAGLAPSPGGRYVAFSQTDAYLGGGHIARTKGLWLTTSGGQDTHLLVRPPASSRPDEPYDVTAVSWSPDGHTLAYTVNVFTDTPVASSILTQAGLWLTRDDRPHPRQVVALTALERSGPTLTAACGSTPAGLSINAVSWAPEARTVAVSVECEDASVPKVAQAVLAVDTTTGQAQVIVADARDAAFAPGSTRLAYVTGARTRRRTWRCG